MSGNKSVLAGRLVKYDADQAAKAAEQSAGDGADTDNQQQQPSPEKQQQPAPAPEDEAKETTEYYSSGEESDNEDDEAEVDAETQHSALLSLADEVGVDDENRKETTIDRDAKEK